MSYIENYTDDKGDLYLKYFLIDSSFNSRGWSVDPLILPAIAKNAIGKPFTHLDDVSESLQGDYHPWSMKEGARYGDHLEFAKEKQVGVIVDFSPSSQNAIKSAAGADIVANNGYFATVKVTDPAKKKLYLSNPSAIPDVSPGVLDYDRTPLPAYNLKNIDFVHLAGVPRGAYGDKAKVYASCIGGLECVQHLKGAGLISSQAQFLDSKIQTMSTEQVQQSAVSNEAVANTANQNIGATVEAPASPQPQQTQNTGVLRLKSQTPQQQQKTGIQSDPDFLKLRQEHEKLVEAIKAKELKDQYRSIIPKELFILNGKFDEAGFEKEIEKAAAKGWSPEDVSEFYNTKLEILSLSANIGKPFGASYNSPSDVPELKGASENSSQYDGIRNLCKMFNLGGNI